MGATTPCAVGQQCPRHSGGPDPRTGCTPRVGILFGALRTCWSGMVAPWRQLSFEPPSSAATPGLGRAAALLAAPNPLRQRTLKTTLYPRPGGQPVSGKDPEVKTQPAFPLRHVPVPSPPHPSGVTQLGCHGEQGSFTHRPRGAGVGGGMSVKVSCHRGVTWVLVALSPQAVSRKVSQHPGLCGAPEPLTWGGDWTGRCPPPPNSAGLRVGRAVAQREALGEGRPDGAGTRRGDRGDRKSVV